MMNTMTTEQQKAKDQAAVMLAFAEGKKIECKRKSSNHWVRINDCITPYWDWSDQDYRIAPSQEPTLPPIPDGYELVYIGIIPLPIGWMVAIPGADKWLEIKESRPFTQLADGARFIRPIAKPKMPDGVFWFRLSASCGNASLVTKIVAPYYLALADNTTYKLDDCVTFGYEYSYDRVTWHKFGG